MIQFVLGERLLEIIERYCDNLPTEKGKFLTVEGNTYVAVDNETGDAWTEDFDNIKDAIDWLNGEIEIDDYHERKRLHA